MLSSFFVFCLSFSLLISWFCSLRSRARAVYPMPLRQQNARQTDTSLLQQQQQQQQSFMMGSPTQSSMLSAGTFGSAGVGPTSTTARTYTTTTTAADHTSQQHSVASYLLPREQQPQQPQQPQPPAGLLGAQSQQQPQHLYTASPAAAAAASAPLTKPPTSALPPYGGTSGSRYNTSSDRESELQSEYVLFIFPVCLIISTCVFILFAMCLSVACIQFEIINRMYHCLSVLSVCLCCLDATVCAVSETRRALN